MLLRNFYTALTSSLMGGGSTGISQDVPSEIIAENLVPTRPNGEVYFNQGFHNNLSLLPNNNYSGTLFYTQIPSEMRGNAALVLSDDNTSVNYTDYTMTPLKYDDGTIANITFTAGSETPFTLNSDGSLTAKRRIVIVNRENKKATINQWGIIKGKDAVSTPNYNYTFLLFKEKLNTPFVINENETVNIDVSVTVYPAKPVS